MPALIGSAILMPLACKLLTHSIPFSWALVIGDVHREGEITTVFFNRGCNRKQAFLG
jgi:hypothetical protein